MEISNVLQRGIEEHGGHFPSHLCRRYCQLDNSSSKESVEMTPNGDDPLQSNLMNLNRPVLLKQSNSPDQMANLNRNIEAQTLFFFFLGMNGEPASIRS